MRARAPAPGRGNGLPRVALVVATLLLCALAVSSCVEIRTQVGADRRIKRTVRFLNVPMAHVEAARIELKRLFGKGAGWFIKENNRGQTMDFLATARAVAPKDDPFRQQVGVTDERAGLKVTYTYTEKLTDESLVTSDLERQCVERIPVAYSVQMPGRVKTATPGEPVMRGSEVTWELTMAQLQPPGLTIQVTAERFDRTVIVRDAFITVVILGGVWWVIVRLLVWRRVRAEQLAEIREHERAEKLADDDEGESQAPQPKADEPEAPSEPSLDPFAAETGDAHRPGSDDGAAAPS